MLSEVSQQTLSYKITCKYNLKKKNDTNAFIYKMERDPQM